MSDWYTVVRTCVFHPGYTCVCRPELGGWHEYKQEMVTLPAWTLPGHGFSFCSDGVNKPFEWKRSLAIFWEGQKTFRYFSCLQISRCSFAYWFPSIRLPMASCVPLALHYSWKWPKKTLRCQPVSMERFSFIPWVSGDASLMRGIDLWIIQMDLFSNHFPP